MTIVLVAPKDNMIKDEERVVFSSSLAASSTTATTRTTSSTLEMEENKEQEIRGREMETEDQFDSSSQTITNDVAWKDNNGNILEIGRGGKISKIGGIWYWVGNQPSPSGGKWVSFDCAIVMCFDKFLSSFSTT